MYLGLTYLKFYGSSITIQLLTPEIVLCIFNELWEVVFADSGPPPHVLTICLLILFQFRDSALCIRPADCHREAKLPAE